MTNLSRTWDEHDDISLTHKLRWKDKITSWIQWIRQPSTNEGIPAKSIFTINDRETVPEFLGERTLRKV